MVARLVIAKYRALARCKSALRVTNLEGDANNPNSRKRIITVPNQAEIVREIFEHYAEGMTQLALAQDLNRRGVPSPGSTWKRQSSQRCHHLKLFKIGAVMPYPFPFGQRLSLQGTRRGPGLRIDSPG